MYEYQEKVSNQIKPNVNDDVIINSNGDITRIHKEPEREKTDWIVRRRSDGTRYLTKRSTNRPSSSYSRSALHKEKSTTDLGGTLQTLEEGKYLECDVIVKSDEMKQEENERRREKRKIQRGVKCRDDGVNTGSQKTPADAEAVAKLQKKKKKELSDDVPSTTLLKRRRLVIHRAFDWNNSETLAIF